MLSLTVFVYNVGVTPTIRRYVMNTREFRDKVALLEQWGLCNFWWGITGEDDRTMKMAVREFPDLDRSLRTKITPALKRSRHYQVGDTVRFEKGLGDNERFDDPTIPKGAVGKIISMTYMEYQMSIVVVIDDIEHTITRPISGPEDKHPTGLDITSIDGVW